jgi:hypothetical protein
MSIQASCSTCGRRLSPLGFCDECPDPIADAIRRHDVPARFSTIDDIAEHLERSRAFRDSQQTEGDPS